MLDKVYYSAWGVVGVVTAVVYVVPVPFQVTALMGLGVAHGLFLSRFVKF